MARRRGFRRNARRWPKRAGRLPAPVRRARRQLRRAHRSFQQGHYLHAPQLYQSLAGSASDLGLAQAPTLLLQAGRAYLIVGENEKGLDLLRQAFSLLAAASAHRRFHAARLRIRDELEKLGLGAEADQLEANLQGIAEGIGEQQMPERTDPSWSRPDLPVKCPYCGANLFPDELEGGRDDYASCGYCGSRVIAESEG